MPFKHYIQKLEGRLPEYTVGRSRVVWSSRDYSVQGFYFRGTEDIVKRYIETDQVTQSEWFRVFSWMIGEHIFKRSAGTPTDITNWWRKKFSELDSDQQDFLFAVKDRTIVQQ